MSRDVDSADRGGVVRRRWPLVSGLVAIGLAAALGFIAAARQGQLPFSFDSEWMAELVEERTIWLDVPARLLDWLGGGWFGIIIVPLGIVAVLCLLRNFWGATYYGIAALLSVSLVQTLKAVFDRPRPEDILILADAGSFPSGHVANAATMAVVLAIILNRWWVWAAGAVYVVLMALSRTYLGAHWVSDTIGGALVGIGIAIIVWAPLSDRLRASPA